MSVRVYDNIIDEEMLKAVYDWGQSVSWYCKPLFDEDGKYLSFALLFNSTAREFNFPIQEYSPSLMGNHVTRPDIPKEHQDEKVSMYRHMIGWSDESVKERNPIVWSLWTKINDAVFDGKAKLDGMPEEHVGLSGPKSNFIDGIDFYEKYNVPEDRKMWTCFLNSKSAFKDGARNKRGKASLGRIHKDSDNRISDKHFTVLYISNLEWNPLSGCKIEFHNNDYTGDKHWKHGYNIGHIEKVVSNVPNRVIVYSHSAIHRTRPPQPVASEMAQKIAFRVRG